MRNTLLLILRKMRSNTPQFLGLILLLVIGTTFFITLFTISLRFEETAEQYFIDNAYANVTLYGAFAPETVEFLAKQDGIKSAQGRIVRDLRCDERIIRTITLTDDINIPHIYDGRLPQNVGEALLLKRNAVAMELSIGDTLTLGESEVIITGLAASPEYIYMVQNARTPMAQTSKFGVTYVTRDFFADSNYNEIVILGDYTEIAEIGALYAISREDQMNHYLYRSDLGEVRSFGYIFPTVFAVLIAVVIYVMLTRIIQKERRQIGTMKALGVTDGRVIGIYLSQFCVTALVGAILGGFVTMLICDLIIGIFAGMFEVPTLNFIFYPTLWLMAAAISVALCAASGMVALVRVLKIEPAHAMRPATPKSRKVKLPFTKSMSFNTRYALKSALCNKGRFFAVVFGMAGSCALMAFSFGFYDSVGNTQDKYFNEFANYDMIIRFEPIPLSVEHSAIETDASFKALTLFVDVGVQAEHHTLVIAESGFDMVNIPTAELQNGIIIPEYFSEQWRVKVGDTLNIEGYDTVVSAIVPQHLGLSLYTSFDYLETLTYDFPPIYNTLYVRTSNPTALADELTKNGIDFTTLNDDRTSFNTISESISVLIWFMIVCSVILGITVLYSVGLINLSAREYEYMFMGVMGCSHRSIVLANAKEALLQLFLAIPLGFVAGRLFLEVIKDEFSGSHFVISALVSPLSYAVSAVGVIAVTAIMAAVMSQHIDRLDIVEGLKMQGE